MARLHRKSRGERVTLPSCFAFDTESGICSDGVLRNVEIQICARGSRSLDDVRTWVCDDPYTKFFREWDNLGDIEVHVFNLDWEYRPIVNWLIRNGYTFREGRKLKNLEWDIVQTPTCVYELRLRDARGFEMKFVDDWQLCHDRLKEVIKALRKDPEYNKIMLEAGVEGKEETEVYETWYSLGEDSEEYQSFVRYSKVDAFIQALFCEWLHDHNRDLALTGASMGFKNGIAKTFRGVNAKDLSKKDFFFALRDFSEQYPPLDHRRQVIAEKNITGGYVDGRPGHYYGVFTHGDYSSSYPYEYKFGVLFRGAVHEARPEDFESALNNDKLVCWVVVSFDFDWIEGTLPIISGESCDKLAHALAGVPLEGQHNAKMTKGFVRGGLFTWSYYCNAIKNCYRLKNERIIEVWFAKKDVGRFGRIVEECYIAKSVTDGLIKKMHKSDLNASIHGKTIQKYATGSIIEWPNNVKTTIRREDDTEAVSDKCFMIGFTAMMNARERLIKHGLMLLRAGYHVLMCDTDSIIADCTAKQFREAIGDWFVNGDKTNIENIGKFEIETFEGLEEFDELKIWGLKRYCEISHGKYRKSAFAGMNKELQKSILMEHDPDIVGDKMIWTQNGKTWTGECYAIRPVTKHAERENIFYELPKPKIKRVKRLG